MMFQFGNFGWLSWFLHDDILLYDNGNILKNFRGFISDFRKDYNDIVIFDHALALTG